MTADVLNLSKRPVTPADQPLLRELFYASRPDLAFLPPELQEMQFRAQREHYDVAYPKRRHDLLVVDEVGVGQLITDASTGAVRVVDVTVHPEHRNRGIAGSALRALLSEAHAAGCAVVLSVWVDNLPARELYSRLGFVQNADSEAGYLELESVPDARRV